MTTEERLETLERELSRMKRRLPPAGAQPVGAAPNVIRANSFILEDDNGVPRAMLAMGKYGPALGLADENGKSRAVLAVGKYGPVLDLTDENGKPGAELAMTELGPSLGLADWKGELIWSAP